jgi:hypothetical protein
MELGQIVGDFAAGMQAADHKRPQAASHRDGTRLYKPGIGPFSEDAAVAMVLSEMRARHADAYASAGKRRYQSGRYECDLALGDLPEWAIEVKMARLGRDNGTYEDTTTKKILSPYPDDRSAVTDCRKLANSDFAGRRAVLIYGFDDPNRPIMWLIEAFEAVAARTVALGPREEAPLSHLVHPVFAAGHVWAWEVLPTGSPPSSNASSNADVRDETDANRLEHVGADLPKHRMVSDGFKAARARLLIRSRPVGDDQR